MSWQTRHYCQRPFRKYYTTERQHDSILLSVPVRRSAPAALYKGELARYNPYTPTGGRYWSFEAKEHRCMRKDHFDVTGMSCAACSARVEKSVAKLPGIKEVSVNLLKNSMTVEYDEAALTSEGIVEAVVKAGYGASLREEKGSAGPRAKAAPSPVDIAKQEYEKIWRRLMASVVFAVPLFYISMGHMMGWPLPAFFHGTENAMIFALTLFLLTVPIVFINFKFFRVGFTSLAHGAPNMDSLIALGSSAALVYGVYALYKIAFGLGHGDLEMVSQFSMDLYFESAGMILTLISVGKFFEARAKGRTSDAINKLMNLAPKTAFVVRGGVEAEIPVEEVEKGETVVVRAGQAVPVDGVLTEGHAAVDESAITGESIPVEKQPGDKLIGATTVKSGYLKMRATGVGDETALAQIVRLVDEATSSKAPIAKLADKVSGVFVPVVIAIALVTAAGWLIAGESVEFALSRGATNGILIKSAEALETAHDVKTVVLDKTGTITRGEPAVTDVLHRSDMSAEEFLTLAASLEKYSGHPLGEAIAAKAAEDKLPMKPVADFAQEPGKGVRGKIDGALVCGGNRKLMEEFGLYGVREKELEEKLADEGKTPLFFVRDGRFIGIIALADVVKPTSRRAVNELHEMGIKVVMLTGDNERTARAIQRDVGADEVIAEVLPQDKEKEVRRIQESGQKVAMVGDGINDAPALARADVGIAIGAGTDVAIESAGVVLMRSDLLDVAGAIQLGKAVIRNIKENLFWALFYNTICIPVAAGIFYPSFGLKLSPMIGALAMSFSSVFVVSNALRLRLFKPKFAAAAAVDGGGEKSGARCNVAAITVEDKTEVIKETKGEDVKMKKVLHVEGMMCQMCVKHVTQALKNVAGVEAVEVSLEAKTAAVTLGAEVEDAVLAKAVTDAGYEVTGVEAA